jgi:UDP-GlcNAc:undecaprenyl-phosphate GlcNAc-1-phosphate transferase
MSFADTLEAVAGNGTVVWGFLLAAVLAYGLTPLTARLAHRVDALDHGGDRPRIHTAPIPRIGGLAIVGAIVVALLVLVRPGGALIGVLIALPVVAAIGLVDDLRGMRPSVKFVAVLLAALIPVIGYDLSFHHVTLPVLGDFDIGNLGTVLTILWIAFVANLVNLIDGMDSLAAGIVGIACLSFTVLAASFGRMEVAATAAVVAGATAGFLPHNYHPAKIFMGDSGSLALGFLLASLAVEGVLKSAATIALLSPLLVIAVPILDTSFVVMKRLKYRRPPWTADHNHFYHRALRIGLSQRKTAAYLHLWAALLAGYALLLRFVPPRPGGDWDLSHALIAAGFGLLVIAASIRMIYVLEILKSRHIAAFRLGRPRGGGGPGEGDEEAVERALTGAGRR